MESVFLRFNSYDFESEQRFQDGLKRLQQDSSGADRLTDMKLFFYNRFVEPIDHRGYKQWSSASPAVTVTEQQDKATPPLCDFGAEQQAQATPPLSDCASSPQQAEEEVQLPFAEVMRLILEGKEVPGAEQLEIKASNEKPTPSHMERPAKPWERDTS